MTWLKNTMKGARREKGAAKRKRPVTAEDLNRVYNLDDWRNPDSVTLRGVITIAWFFIPMMRGYIERWPIDTGGRPIRRPLLMGEIEPLIDCKRYEWPGDVSGIPSYTPGSKTDWLNQGVVRSRNLIPLAESNSLLFPVRGLVRLWGLSPSEFHRKTDRACAAWRSGKAIKPDWAVSLLRLAVFKKGLNQSAFSLHSLRAGGATELYRDTGNIDLAARMWRLETAP